MAPLADLKYDTCNINELQDFVKARARQNLPEPLARGKNHFIARLRQLDEAWTFRFTDLPTELRDLVLRELLLLRKPKCEAHYCWPAILCTSRQVSNEAKDVLYAENQFEINFTTMSINVGGELVVGDTILFHPTLRSCLPFSWDGFWNDRDERHLGSARSLFSHQLWRKIHKLRICGHLDVCISDDDKVASGRLNNFNYMMYGLVEVLAESTCLKDIEIELLFAKRDDSDQFANFKAQEPLIRALYPITRIANGASTQTITFSTGNDPTSECLPHKMIRALEQQFKAGTPEPTSPITSMLILRNKAMILGGSSERNGSALA